MDFDRYTIVLLLSPDDPPELSDEEAVRLQDAHLSHLAEAIAETRSLHPREAVRALADRVLDATGHTLNDDATVLCLDWHGGHGRDRESVHGADQGRASDPLA